MRSSEPIARGVLLVQADRHKDALGILARESLSILRALNAPAEVAERADPSADYVVLLVEEGSDPRKVELPDLKDRAGASYAIADDEAEGRVAVATARKHLRAHGAALGARELVFRPSQLGYLGLESDGLREKLEILLRALVLDAERLRLKREGWEEPDA